MCVEGGEKGFSNDNMATDGSSVISNSVIDGILESSLRVTIYYNLLCIRVCDF